MNPDNTAVSPLIAHVVFRLDIGGLENGLVNIVNSTETKCFRHAIICLTEASLFRKRICRPDVEIIELNKIPGHSWRIHHTLWQVFKRLRPTILHTRNLACLEAQIPGLLAGIPARVHSEHGIEKQTKRHLLLRKLLRSLVHLYIPLSTDLETWMTDEVGIEKKRVLKICNGVDTNKFSPRYDLTPITLPSGFVPVNGFVIGTIGRLAPIKDQRTLIEAFAKLIALRPDMRNRLRLVIIGDGDLKTQLAELLKARNIADITWMPGSRDDIPDILRSMDIFVLPSLNEGISNTILEAMACGLPVIASDVGGNRELVFDGITGRRIPKQDPNSLAMAIAEYLDTPDRASKHGNAAREKCLELFSLDRMMHEYSTMYFSLLNRYTQYGNI